MSKKINIGVFTEQYPSLENKYASSFVHSRCKAYKRLGHRITVYCLTDACHDYAFEGIPVHSGNEDELIRLLKQRKPDVLCCHMPNMRETYFLKTLDKIPKILWFHGNESLWSAFLYPYEGNPALILAKFARRLYIDIKKRFVLREYIHKNQPQMVFVSEWMRTNSEQLLGRLPDELCNIIPNPIDEKVFKYKQRTGNISKLVCVRPHSTRKYAVDLVIKAFQNSKYSVDIYGKGPLMAEHKKLAKKIDANVRFISRFFDQKGLSNLYLKYKMGIMLTRLDAQGVSACEMQMTGMPLITSDIPGNKEFTTRGTFRIDNARIYEIPKIIDKVNHDRNTAQLSKWSREDMIKLAGLTNVINKELALMKKVITF